MILRHVLVSTSRKQAHDVVASFPSGVVARYRRAAREPRGCTLVRRCRIPRSISQCLFAGRKGATGNPLVHSDGISQTTRIQGGVGRSYLDLVYRGQFQSFCAYLLDMLSGAAQMAAVWQLSASMNVEYKKEQYTDWFETPIDFTFPTFFASSSARPVPRRFSFPESGLCIR